MMNTVALIRAMDKLEIDDLISEIDYRSEYKKVFKPPQLTDRVIWELYMYRCALVVIGIRGYSKNDRKADHAALLASQYCLTDGQIRLSDRNDVTFDAAVTLKRMIMERMNAYMASGFTADPEKTTAKLCYTFIGIPQDTELRKRRLRTAENSLRR